MKNIRLILAILAGLAPLSTAQANVVRPAPDFLVTGGRTLKSLRGQPVILLVAPSPRSRAFRSQVKRLEKDYRRFAAQNAVFVAAFTENSEGLRSSIPFAIAPNGPEVAARLGLTGPFHLLVIGRDGNIDLRTNKVSGAYAVRDAILNNYTMQAASRRL